MKLKNKLILGFGVILLLIVTDLPYLVIPLYKLVAGIYAFVHSG